MLTLWSHSPTTLERCTLDLAMANFESDDVSMLLGSQAAPCRAL
jgi:hypothetical protein